MAYSEKLNRTVTLEDICFSPLSPDNPNCTIQSILNYYQNDQANLDKTIGDFWVEADYIDHFSYCARSETKLRLMPECLVQCYIVLSFGVWCLHL